MNIPMLQMTLSYEDYDKLLHLLRVAAGYGRNEAERFTEGDGYGRVPAWHSNLSLSQLHHSEWGAWLASILTMPDALLIYARWAMTHSARTVADVGYTYDVDGPARPNQATEDFRNAADTYRLACAVAAGTLTGRDAGSYAYLPEGAHYDTFTVHMLAEVFGLSDDRIRRLAVRLHIGRKHGRDWLFSTADVAVLRARNTQRGRPPLEAQER